MPLSGHLGLRSMRERAASVGGTLEISVRWTRDADCAFVSGPARTSSVLAIDRSTGISFRPGHGK
jgi:hypothetical protein